MSKYFSLQKLQELKVQGLSSRAIAEQLGVSHQTIQNRWDKFQQMQQKLQTNEIIHPSNAFSDAMIETSITGVEVPSEWLSLKGETLQEKIFEELDQPIQLLVDARNRKDFNGVYETVCNLSDAANGMMGRLIKMALNCQRIEVKLDFTKGKKNNADS